ncbi:MAG: hypothetical protein QM778_21290 [Myxococcales bacterium]
MRLYSAAFGGLLYLAGCGPGGSNGNVDDDGDSGLGDGDGGIDGSMGGDGDQNPMPSTSPLVLTPTDQTLTLNSSAPATLQFAATQDDRAISPVWTVDRVEIGNIDPATGMFTASGKAAGVVKITAKYGNITGSINLTVAINWTDTAGDPNYQAAPTDPGAGGFGGVGGDGPAPGATPDQQTVLNGTPVADADVKLLYPYDNTVLPRGLLPPVLQWANGPANDLDKHTFTSAMLHLSTTNFEYKGYFAAPPKSGFSNTNLFDNLIVPTAIWNAAVLSSASAPLSIELVFGEAAQAVGPVKVQVTIAQASLKGTVYYNSYGTKVLVDGMPLANSGEPSCGLTDNASDCRSDGSKRTGPDFGAGTLAIKPGRTAPDVVAGTNSDDQTGCRVCHSVAAQGNNLHSVHGDNGYKNSSIYDLRMDPIAETMPGTQNITYPAIYPDGSFAVSFAGDSPLRTDGSSQVYSLPDLANQGRRGLPETLKARLPAFSPDGKRLAFNWGNDAAGGDNKSLAIVDYDPATQTFGAVQKLYTPENGKPVAWPSFTPDGKGIVFEVEVEENEYGFTRNGVKAELWYIDIESKQAVRLDGLNGSGSPYGTNHDKDNQQNFEPTVNPVVSGGYAWVVFTSRRMYGQIAHVDPRTSDPREYNWQDPKQITPKKLWVAALDLNPEPGKDPSHPAFYLPAQELQAGNMRGYWVLDPCKGDGMSCETGDECCGGYCGGPAGATTCSATAPSCSAEYDRCEKNEDCCGFATEGMECINNICALAAPVLF